MSASDTLPGGILERTSVFSQPDRLKHKLVPGFVLRILWCSESGNHPGNNFAIFGYIIDMKVEKNRILLYSCVPTVFIYNILSLSGGGRPFHPSVPYPSIQVPQPQEEDNGRARGGRMAAAVYPNVYVIQSCSLWKTPVVLQFAKSYKLIFKN